MDVNYFLSALLLIYVIMMVFLCGYSWKKDKIYLSLSLIPISIYVCGYAFEILNTNIEKVKLWTNIEYLGIPFIGVFWLLLALNFTEQKKKLEMKKLMPLFIIPVITVIMNYTNDFHHLFYIKMYMNNREPFSIVEIERGPWYWVNVIYTYLLLLIGVVILIKAYSKAIPIIRKQIVLLIIAWVIPWISDIVYSLEIVPFHIDLCPFALSFSGVMYSISILKFKFFKLKSIATEKVFYSMLDGVIILDNENNIVNFNDSAKNIIPELGDMDADLIKIKETFEEYKRCNSAEGVLSIKNSQQLQYYRVSVNNISENNNKIIGKIITLNDITESELYKEKLIIEIEEQKKKQEKINKLLKLKEAMIKIGYSINEMSNINDLLRLILDEVINCIDQSSMGSVLLLNEDNNLKIAVAKGYKPESINTFSLKLEEHFGYFYNGYTTDRTVIYNDIQNNKDIKMLDTAEGEKIKSSISSPIIINNQLYGFLNIDSVYNNIFNESDFELMEYMRSQVANAITRHKLYEETVHLSRYDKLTNVYNRSYFEQLFYDYIKKDSTYKKQFFTVVFDLNELKTINDNYGHLAGDELIKLFSKGLIGLAKDSDIIGRFGGDEFVGVFFNEELLSLTNKFEALQKHFAGNPISFEKNKIVCSYSYGIANYPIDGEKFNQLIKAADERMYKYKNEIKMEV